MIGADLLQRHGVPAQVVHAVRAHHYDEEPHSIEALLLIAADAISAARPGARRESLEAYVKRLEKLEEIANSFQGVQQSVRHPGRTRGPDPGQAGTDRRHCGPAHGPGHREANRIAS